MKNNYMHEQLGQNMNSKVHKDQKANCHFWAAGSKSRVLLMIPALSITEGMADHLNHHSSLTPGPTPTLTPYKESAHHCSLHPCPSRERARETIVFTPCETPIKPCLNFLSGLLSISIDSGRPRTQLVTERTLMPITWILYFSLNIHTLAGSILLM